MSPFRCVKQCDISFLPNTTIRYIVNIPIYDSNVLCVVKSPEELLLFVEILFAVRTITFRSIFLFKMHNGHALPHNFSLQHMAKFLPVSIAHMVVFTRIAKSYESENFEK